MPSEKETFFQLPSFAVVGDSVRKSFPKLTYGNLKRLGKKVIPVDLSGAPRVEGDAAHAELSAVEDVAGVIVEVAPEQVKGVVGQAIDMGIKNIWLHMGCDSPEVLDLCKEKGVKVHWGTCAVMYTKQGVSYHSIHKLIMKLSGKY